MPIESSDPDRRIESLFKSLGNPDDSLFRENALAGHCSGLGSGFLVNDLEEFGNGIMSAIDLDMTMERQPDQKGDRVKIAMSGKFLGYKSY